MKKNFLILLLLFLSISCKNKINEDGLNSSEQGIIDISNKNIPTLNYKELKPYLNQKDNTTYVVNFWATWCAPCVKELPYFENIQKNYGSKNVKVILVSLDFPDKKETALLPYVKKKNLQSKVLHLDDPNEQFWIADVSEDWSGAIPATLIYNKERREFYEQSFSQEELENEIQTFLN